jgi:Leucine-rich repeat (LRR) protein
MCSNHSKIIELTIAKEEITHFDSSNQEIKLLGASLRKLDMSSNFLRTIENIDPLTNLRELNLSYNKIKNIENL